MRTDTYNAMSIEDHRLNNDTHSIDSMIDGTKPKIGSGGERPSEKISEKVGHLADDAKSSMSAAASSIATGVSEAIDTTTEKVEEGWKSMKGMYEGSTVSKVSDEISTLVKKYPLQSFLGAIAVGTWLGIKASSHLSSQK